MLTPKFNGDPKEYPSREGDGEGVQNKEAISQNLSYSLCWTYRCPPKFSAIPFFSSLIFVWYLIPQHKFHLWEKLIPHQVLERLGIQMRLMLQA